ncbi:hypothetical protein JCM10296v2_000747 [Rhodotorula toruloides]
MTNTAQRLFARLTSPSFNTSPGSRRPLPLPPSTNPSISPSTSSSSRLSLLDLPTELLERVVEIAWPDLSIKASSEDAPFWSNKFRWAPAVLDHVREFVVEQAAFFILGEGHEQTFQAVPFPSTDFAMLCYAMRNLELLDITGIYDQQMDRTFYDESDATDTDFLPNLKELRLLYNPFKATEPLRSQRLRELDRHTRLKRLVLYSRTPKPQAQADASVPQTETTFASVGLSALAFPCRPTSIDLLFGKGEALESEPSAWLVELFRSLSNLVHLALDRIPSATTLIRLLDALPEPSRLRYLKAYFALPSDADPSFHISDPSHGDHYCDQQHKRLSSTTTIVINNTASFLDDLSLQALRERPPLRRVHFMDSGVAPADEPSAFLDAVKALGPHAPQEMEIDDTNHYRPWRTTIDYIRFRPVFADGRFPSLNDTFDDYNIPRGQWVDRMDGWIKLIEYCDASGLSLTGTMRESVKFVQDWRSEVATYGRLRADHDAVRGLWGEGGPLSVTPDYEVYEELCRLLRNHNW